MSGWPQRPGAEFVLVTEANHILMTDQLELVEQALVDWLARPER